MHYLLLITDDQRVPAHAADHARAPDVEAWWQRLHDAGKYVFGAPLRTAPDAVTVRVRGGQTQATPGTLSASPGLLGLDIVACDSLEEAVAIAAGHPMAWTHAIEVRAFTTLD
jgi:hypothetical protein